MTRDRRSPHGRASRTASGPRSRSRARSSTARSNVLLDEPTNGLDVMSTRAVRTIVRRLRDDGPLRAVLEPRDAGSVGAVRRDRRHRARPVVARGTPDELRAADRSREPRRCVRGACRRSSGEHASEPWSRKPSADRHRHAQGAEGFAARSARALGRSCSASSSARCLSAS